MRTQFNDALALLNSDDSESVKKGFVQMKELAAADYDSAKIELGLTYFPYLHAKSLKDSLDNPILKRRYHLKLKSKTDADSVIMYLNKSSYLPPEASHILGCTYFKAGNRQEALTMFHQAKYSINKAKEVGHGYDTDSLKKAIIRNISTLQKEKGTK